MLFAADRRKDQGQSHSGIADEEGDYNNGQRIVTT
jgi:hypothetical protein